MTNEEALKEQARSREKPPKNHFFWVGHLILVIVGILAAYYVSPDFRSHVFDLQAHLRSGTWEVTTNRKAIEARLKVQYGSEPRKWIVHYVAGSNFALSVLPQVREETLQTIGTWVLKDDPLLSYGLAPLWSEYRGFLTSALVETAQQAHGRDASHLTSLAAAIFPSSGWTRPVSTAQLEDAQRILAKLPRTSGLSNALQSYRRYEQERLHQVPFPVATSPAYDEEDAGDKKAVPLEQETKCRANVTPTRGPSNPVLTTMAVFPRVVEVQLIRPWLSDTLLDDYERRDSATTASFFGSPSRRLGVIPSRLWILMAEEAELDVTNDQDGKILETWTQESRCCVATCEALSLSLSPIDNFHPSSRAYRLRRADAIPILFAIVSRRREPR